MSLIADVKSLEPSQRSAIWASYLGWTLDAFDYFLLVFMLGAIAKEFHTDVKAVTVAIMLTLAARPIGAFAFGWLAERFGRRPVLMADIILFSLFELASGFAPSLTSLLVLRFLFGIAMGGEWGLGASLAMESIPARLRGPVSGLLQSGYPSGYFVASLVYFLLFDTIGWRGMFMVGVALNAHSGTTGSASRLAMMIARLRPIRSDQMPNAIPPTIAPTFMIAVSVPVRWVEKWCCC